MVSPITFATSSSPDYATITALVLNMRGIGANAQKPVDDVIATVRIGGEYVDLQVPDSIYSRYDGAGEKRERHWRTPLDASIREQAWRASLKKQVADLAERL
ncbi:MAG: hypothetical protein HYT16_00165 [DPANN group archaeon]|nr:hypothetical protein [DPANN group archaeon]